MSSYESSRISRSVNKNFLKTAFGEIKTAQPSPNISFTFDRLIGGKWNTFKTPYGNSLKALSTGTSVDFTSDGGCMKLKSDESEPDVNTTVRSPYLKYSSGTGLEFLVTAVFSNSFDGDVFHRMGVGMGAVDPSLESLTQNFLGFGYILFEGKQEFQIVHVREGAIKAIYYQSEWSEDRCDGTRSFPDMDWGTGNLFKVQLSYLGFGSIWFSILNPNTGYFEHVHKIPYANENVETSLSSTNLCCLTQYATTLTGNPPNGFDNFMKIGSWSIRHEGHYTVNRELLAHTTLKTGITTEAHMFSIRNPSTELFYGKGNTQPIELDSLSIGAKSQASKTSIVRIYRNAVLTGPVWNSTDVDLSPAQIDETGVFVSGQLVSAYSLSSDGTLNVILTKARDSADHYGLDVDESITFTAESTGSVNVSLSLVFNNL